MVRTRVRWLIRAWDLSTVASRHGKRFGSLDERAQARWLERSYRSKSAVRRLHVAALKQLVFLAWASTGAVEDALGYDYTCRDDGVARGTRRASAPGSTPAATIPEPDDYVRPGPAHSGGAIPVRLLDRRGSGTGEVARLTTTAWPDLADGARERTDVVVIGSGAGGAVAASTLAEAGLDVIVVEEGEEVSAESDFRGPPFERFQRMCRDDATTQAWGKPPIPMPIGRVVGGTTVVNCGTCFRAPRRVVSRWRSEYGVTDGYDELVGHFDAVEDALNIRPVPWELLGPNGMAAHKGAVALGYSGGPLLRNITGCHGCGQCVFGCPSNAKQAMHISYLPRAQAAGARVLSRCRAERIELDDGGRARAVRVALLDESYRRRGSMRIECRTVVLAAGAIGSPLLLDASGIPDPSGQTGHNLRIHPATGVGAFFESDDPHWKGTLQSYYIDQFFDSHDLMFEATTTVPGIGAGSVPGIGAHAMTELRDFAKLATLGFSVADTSTGRVRRTPKNGYLVTYRLNATDARRISLGLAIASEVMLAAGAARVYPGLPGVESISAREDLEGLRDKPVRPHQLRLTAFHPMGTVRMGADPDRSVVDPWGRHHRVPNLWVTDASTFPTCVGVNPQLTIMALAKRSAEALAANG
jgi:NAD-dependent dihydropyrimidine dehydrogenase PreA subunit